MKILIIALVFVAVIAGGALLLGNKATTSNTMQIQNQTQTQPSVSTIPETSGTVSKAPLQTFSSTDVAAHNRADDCWLIIDNNVYDVTKFIPDHPGGMEIVKGCGRDATSMFTREREHQENNAASLLPPYQIGKLQ